MRVRCINAGELRHRGSILFGPSNLTEGAIYDVTEESTEAYHINEFPYGLLKERFEVVEDEVEESYISKLFEEKVRELRSFIEGDKVHYEGMHGNENGIIKSIQPDNQAFVVYRCGQDWENYRNYTGVLTPLKNLKLGWI